MAQNYDYPVIDKGMNGSFIQHKDKWHRFLEESGTCYGCPDKVRGSIVLVNSDFINDRLIISKDTVNLDYIESLEFRRF